MFVDLVTILGAVEAPAGVPHELLVSSLVRNLPLLLPWAGSRAQWCP
jgi:hypothetical protein